MGTYDVLKVEKIGDIAVKLTQLEGRYRLVSIQEPNARFPAYRMVLAVKRTFRTLEVANLAFDFMVAFNRAFAAMRAGEPTDGLMDAAKSASEALNTAMEKHGDRPPEVEHS